MSGRGAAGDAAHKSRRSRRLRPPWAISCERGADPTPESYTRWSALHGAAEASRRCVCRTMLLAPGAARRKGEDAA